MTIEAIIISIINITTMILLVGIVAVFGLSFFWNLKFIMATNWLKYSVLKLYMAIISLTFVIAYGYILFSSIIGTPVEISFYGEVIIRPLVFMLGGACAANARFRYISLKTLGGEAWTLKSRN